jgi:type II restriction enzyme
VDLALDPALGAGFHSRSQIARTMTQGWIERELGCLSCSATRLRPTPQNTKARDFVCGDCQEPYELKSTSGQFGRWVVDGQYETLRSVIASGQAPNLLLMEYDRLLNRVRTLSAIHRHLLSPLAVVARAELKPPARRAGWKGCNIDLSLVPEDGRIRIVSGSAPVPWTEVRASWSHVGFLVNLRPPDRGWVRDILAVLQKLPESFQVSDVYRFESELADLHPRNRHVQPKIRQQLQILVRNGILIRSKRGTYVRSTASPTLAPGQPTGSAESFRRSRPPI